MYSDGEARGALQYTDAMIRTTAPRRRFGWGLRAAVGAGEGGAIGRRGVLALAAAVPLLTAAGGEEAPRTRRARFEEVGDTVLMTVSLPELLLTADGEAMAALEAAFVTTLTYEIAMYRGREREPTARRRVVVRVQWNAWKERYVVTVEEPGRGATTRQYTDRDDAIAAAVTLERLRIAETGDLERGPDVTYFATVVGQRNPVERGLLSPGPGGETRRVASTFSHWIAIFIRAQQRAEKSITIKTSPAFYLVPR